MSVAMIENIFTEGDVWSRNQTDSDSTQRKTKQA